MKIKQVNNIRIDRDADGLYRCRHHSTTLEEFGNLASAEKYCRGIHDFLKRKPLQLDEFTKAYVVCALWATNDESDDQGGDPLDQNYDIEDIDRATLNRMIEDCQAFQAENSADLAQYNSPEWTPAELGGHDFFLTRNGHGAGFWDRDCLPKEAGERLTAASERWGEFTLYVGDDGVIYHF